MCNEYGLIFIFFVVGCVQKELTFHTNIYISICFLRGLGIGRTMMMLYVYWFVSAVYVRFSCCHFTTRFWRTPVAPVV